MNAPLTLTRSEDCLYPDSDGNLMADNTKQYQWIVTIQGNLDKWFVNDADVFVAGDLLWYAVEGKPTLRVAPDVMVVFGRPKGHRGFYKQWLEDNIAPQVVFEIWSPFVEWALQKEQETKRAEEAIQQKEEAIQQKQEAIRQKQEAIKLAEQERQRAEAAESRFGSVAGVT